MERLIPLISRLHDIGIAVGTALPAGTAATPASFSTQLPQIAVVGAQSSGKSSVLEAIVKDDFLPRGNGIVTRRPLILQLQNHTSKYGEFNHKPGVKFHNFADIKAEIEKETDRIAGVGKGISAEPILLRIYSPHVIDLTLIDLPGITKIPVGEQPPDIDIQIRRVVLSFIREPICLILAVTAANTDLANSDALQLAREVDPQGQRTIGVLTKCDLIDTDDEGIDSLANRVYPLQLGYVAVVCRRVNNSLEQSLSYEQEFFNAHPIYSKFVHRCGTRFLATVLNWVLIKHIQEFIPTLRVKIQTLLSEAESQLALYQDPLGEVEGNKGALLLQYFSTFARNFQEAIDGRLPGLSDLDQLAGGARLNYIFHDWFAETLSKFDTLDGLSDQEIRIAIRNATGPKASLFVPEGAFEVLVRKQIRKLLQPSLQCVDQVYEELQRMVERCELPEMSRFAALRTRILDVVSQVLKRCLGPTTQMIHNLIAMELAYCNTSHPDFRAKAALLASGDPSGSSFVNAAPNGTIYNNNNNNNGSSHGNNSHQNNLQQQRRILPQHMACGLGTADTLREVASAVDGANRNRRSRDPEPPSNENWQKNNNRKGNIKNGLQLPIMPSCITPPEELTERDRQEVIIIKAVLSSYFAIVRKNVADYVPKAIMGFMVNQAREAIQRELVSKLYKPELFDQLLTESEEVASVRNEVIQRVNALRAAYDVALQLQNIETSDNETP